MNRRKFLKGALALTGASLATGFYTWQIEPFWVEFVSLKMPLPHLPDYWQGKTLMQISDMHVGKRFDRQYLIDAFKVAKTFEPDVVVYTGDFVNYKNSEQFGQLDEVLAQAVLGKEQTWGILGNHDYGKNWAESKVAEKITQIATKNGITMLRNEKISVEGLTVIGLDDFWGLNYNPSPVLAQAQPSEATIVLCHNPDVADQVVWHDFEGWILAGHTHGGQCKPPFLPPPMLPVKNKNYTAGIFELPNNRTLYINRALGHLWQVRFNVRPEITLFLRLKKYKNQSIGLITPFLS